MNFFIALIIIITVAFCIYAFISVFNEGVTIDDGRGIRYPNTKIISEDKQLYEKYGMTYIKHCKDEMLKAQKSENYYKKELNYIRKQADCASLLFEEYFAQDQTNDDLLVLALEAIQRCSSERLLKYSTEEKAQAIKTALNKMSFEITKIDSSKKNSKHMYS